MSKKNYDCANCGSSYCCSYPIIAVTKKDIQRLADGLGMTFKEARRKFTQKNGKNGYKIRRKKDLFHGMICMNFSPKKGCTVYEHRMEVCRNYPGNRCGYYEFLQREREGQGNPKLVIGINIEKDYVNLLKAPPKSKVTLRD